MFKAEYVNPFLEAALTVFKIELDTEIEKDSVSMRASAMTTQEINVLIVIEGDIHGQVVYGLSEKTAKKIAVKMTGQPIITLNELAQSAISELGNMITGQATTKLSDTYSSLALTPPTLVFDRDVLISTIEVNRLYIVLSSEMGDIEVSVAFDNKAIPSKINVFHPHRATA